MTPEETAWVAGFLEGEGWFCVDPSGRFRVGANQVNPEPLERLQALLGGSIYKRNKIDGKKGNQWPNRRPWFGWETRDRETIIALTAQIRPWLSKDRLGRIPWVEIDLPVVIESIGGEK